MSESRPPSQNDTLKKRITAAESERVISVEIAKSELCPAAAQIRIESTSNGKWTVVPDANASADARCARRIAAIAARLQVAFELIE
jgi:hypothetical protein